MAGRTAVCVVVNKRLIHDSDDVMKSRVAGRERPVERNAQHFTVNAASGKKWLTASIADIVDANREENDALLSSIILQFITV